MAENDVPTPSGTVVALRDAPRGLEVLLLQRAPRAADSGTPAWVFPGGKVESADQHGPDEVSRARLAAVREAHEEAGLVLVENELTLISRWITPEVSARRFDTWFFATRLGPDTPVVVDGMEIGDHRWLPPREALAAFHQRELKLAPPTFVTISWLCEHEHAAGALDSFAAAEVVSFRPRICRQEGGACILYPGDSGYEAGDPERPGPRHRLWALPDGFRYERLP